MSFSVIQHRADPRMLSVNITSKSGRVFRWGADESDAQNVPSGLQINTQIPGGFGSMSCTLTRRPDLTYYDLDGFAPCTVSGDSGGLVAFDGYLSAQPMQRGQGYSFTPQAVGWSSHMTDDGSFTMVYIDRQLSKWVGPSTARQAAVLAGATQLGSAFSTQTNVDQSGNPGFSFLANGGWAGSQAAELWYDAGANNLIARVQGSNFVYQNLTGGDANVLRGIYTGTSDSPGSFSGGNQDVGPGIGATSPAWVVTDTANRFVLLQGGYNVAFGTSGAMYGFIVYNPAVVGNHGLTLRAGPSGSSPGPDDGFFGADVVRDIITRAAPLLSTGGIIQDNFVVPHMVFNTPVTPDAAVQQVNQYYLNDYGVYENREFFWRPPGSGRQWLLRVGDGVTLQDQGPQIETAFNGVVVQFTDAGGATRYVGPPGYGGDATDASLQDTSSTNPVNAYGRKRWALVQMTSTSTTNGAIKVGATFLAATTGRPSQGSAVVTGFGRDSDGRDWPAWMIRAGDTVVFVDTNDQTPRYVLSTSYSHDSLQNTLTLDAPPNRLDWIMARLGLVISAID